MAAMLARRALKSVRYSDSITRSRSLSTISAARQSESDGQPSSTSFTFDKPEEQPVYVKAKNARRMDEAATSVTMPTSFMTGSIVGKRFYRKVTTREADDGNGWTVMLDYRTLKTPSKRPLKLRSLALAKAIAAEWEYQQKDGIRPFTMPLMKLACTALERVPLTRSKTIANLVDKMNQDLVFYRAPDDNDLTSEIHNRQVEKIDPLLKWVESEFGFKPKVYSSIFGGKQDDGLLKAVEDLLKKSNDYELAAIDALSAAAHSLVIAIGIFRGKLQIEDAIELTRLEEDSQVDKWGLVEGGHDIDIADLKVQISSATVFLGLSQTN
ncbi:PREDICTED: ATP synthase mitochondrial F1 complex assembly factor 2 [Tarenaya hassleriana]|uniref:ATP synthase mitochondrial F1 complex assembly factor 2 n=1 Tax=Tarenaya hassleriana TaxID=28532 RepID=UPI00053C125A|nr:PREDICTED: ATP synthase mitochondrial F1 complex assembly factor 2 [Tarenaya hassleriana]XP_010555917.1 PREDICTED: ATP synthase mitochondrial F1 complex assembly factor 2 [Tarenaya hassleriana]